MLGPEGALELGRRLAVCAGVSMSGRQRRISPAFRSGLLQHDDL
jgi:hypothetical protein